MKVHSIKILCIQLCTHQYHPPTIQECRREAKKMYKLAERQKSHELLTSAACMKKELL